MGGACFPVGRGGSARHCRWFVSLGFFWTAGAPPPVEFSWSLKTAFCRKFAAQCRLFFYQKTLTKRLARNNLEKPYTDKESAVFHVLKFLNKCTKIPYILF